MFSYDELIAYRKRYYFKLDTDTGERKLFDRDISDFISNSPDYDTILAALGIMDTLGNVQSDFGSSSLNRAPYKTTEEKIAWEKEQVALLQESLYKTLSSGSYNFHENLSELGKSGLVERTFFQRLAKPEKYPNYATKQASCLMDYLLDSHEKKLVSYDVQKQIEGKFNTIYDFTFNTREKTFSEKLNPNSPQYTQPQKPKEISEENKAQAKEFVEKLISYYRLAETDEAYQLRVESEDKNMQLVANTINHSETLGSISSGKKFINRLMAAQNLSLEGQTDYLEALISQPAVYDTILQIKNDGIHRQIKEKAEQNIANGKQRRHHETKGEAGLRIANRTIAKDPNFMEKATRFVTTKSNFSVEKQEDAYALSAVARTQGKIPSFTQNQNGEFDFNTDEQITR